VATLRYSVSRPVLPLSVTLLVVLGFRAANGVEAPPAAMRLPGWIQSLRTSDAPTSETDPPAAQTSAVIPAAGTEPTTPRVSQVADWKDPRPPSPPAQAVIPTATSRAAPSAAQPPAAGFRRWISERVASLPKPIALGTQPAADEQNTPASAAVATEEPVPPTINAPVAATPDEMPTLSIDPASCRGALPGKTSRAELDAEWGPREPAVEGEPEGVATWKIEPFERVEVSFAGDTVATIRIKLAAPMGVADLARQLEIADLRTVAIRDEQGNGIGEVYPERGVILSLEPGTRQATAILIEPLDPDAFVLRAEEELDSCSAYALADLRPVDFFALSVGGRVDSWNQRTDFVQFNPRAVAMLFPTDNDVVKVIAGRGFRVGDISERLTSTPTVIALPGPIDPETAWTGEIEALADGSGGGEQVIYLAQVKCEAHGSID
jgi:hypothetical protein